MSHLFLQADFISKLTSRVQFRITSLLVFWLSPKIIPCYTVFLYRQIARALVLTAKMEMAMISR